MTKLVGLQVYEYSTTYNFFDIIIDISFYIHIIKEQNQVSYFQRRINAYTYNHHEISKENIKELLHNILINSKFMFIIDTDEQEILTIIQDQINKNVKETLDETFINLFELLLSDNSCNCKICKCSK